MPEVDIIEIDGNLVYRQAFSEVARLLRRYQAAQGRLDHLLALPLPDVDPWPRAAAWGHGWSARRKRSAAWPYRFAGD